jgi:hypothetical protein
MRGGGGGGDDYGRDEKSKNSCLSAAALAVLMNGSYRV